MIDLIDTNPMYGMITTNTQQNVSDKFGSKLLPNSPRRYCKNSKVAQEAHEAIRPTSIYRDPASLKSYLDNDQYNLYELI